jgi:hypothetical protein
MIAIMMRETKTPRTLSAIRHEGLQSLRDASPRDVLIACKSVKPSDSSSIFEVR